MATYKITSHAGNGLPLNVATSSAITGRTNVNIWSNTDSTDQRWSIGSLGTRQQVKSMSNTQYMLNANTATWNCDVYTSNNDTYVNFVNVSAGVYLIQLDSDKSKYLTAEGTTKGSNVKWAARNSSSNTQQWKVETTTVTPPVSGSINTLVQTAKACVSKNLAGCVKYFQQFFPNTVNPNCAWCAWFMCQCGKVAGMDFGNSNSANALVGIKGKVAFSAATPKVGDLIFIDNQGDGKVHHVGLIAEITNDKIKAVEGNMSGSVQTSIVKETSYNRSGYSSVFGSILQIGKNS